MILDTNALSALLDGDKTLVDIWIAAMSLQHKLPVVSQDDHFDRVQGIKRISW